MDYPLSLLITNANQKGKLIIFRKYFYLYNDKKLEITLLMLKKPRIYLVVSAIAFLAVGQQVNANDHRQTKWIIKKYESNVCVAQNSLYGGMLLENKKLTIPLKDMRELEAYKVTINDKVVIPVTKPNLVDTACSCIRVRDMDVLKSDDISIRIDGVTSKDIDVSIKMQIKGIPQAMEELQADNCRKPQKNLASLSMRQ